VSPRWKRPEHATPLGSTPDGRRIRRTFIEVCGHRPALPSLRICGAHQLLGDARRCCRGPCPLAARRIGSSSENRQFLGPRHA